MGVVNAGFLEMSDICNIKMVAPYLIVCPVYLP